MNPLPIDADDIGVVTGAGGPEEVARPLWPYLALMLALTLVIAFLPGVVLFLPNLLGY